MFRTVAAVLVSLVVLPVLTGCGTMSAIQEDGRYDSSEDLREAAIEAGLECEKLKEEDPSLGDPDPDSSCTVDGLRFAFGTRPKKELDLLREDDEPNEDPLIALEGPNWFIITDEEAGEQLTMLQEKLGGEIYE